MYRRTALSQGAQLCFPGLDCHIQAEIGRGSNALVYRAWYADAHHTDERHEILVKELFPLHPGGGIYRGEDQRIVCTPEGEETFALHRASFEAGNEAHLALLRKHPDRAGSNLNTYALNGTLYTVLGFNGGRSLGEELTAPAVRLRPLVERMIKLLDALEGFHDCGLLHLDIAPDNIMLLDKGQRERVMLIDYNSCQDMREAVNAASAVSIKPGYTAPEIRSGRKQDIGPWSDLYSIAAVFFHGIAGEALTPFQMMRPLPPDISKFPCMADTPETVVSWVQAILRKGLCVLRGNRYQSIEAMREDLRELLDRIDGVGVTHWALWEAGWRSVERMIRDNPSLQYLRDPENLYPSVVEWEGVVQPMAACLDQLLSPDGCNTLIVAGGGMGKTTALLRIAYSQFRRYSPDQPAVAYLSLNGRQGDERNHILDRLLETLRFKSDTRSFEDARKTMLELLDQPLKGPRGPRPALLLMLDGLNEISGKSDALFEEILRLSQMPGVRVMAVSRTDESALPFRPLRLMELSEADVRAALSDAGLLMPESPEIQEMLKTPMMLSIFIHTARAEEKQLKVATQDELMALFLATQMEKTAGNQPLNSDIRWQTEAALYYVLPAMAREIDRRGSALTDAQLLPAVSQCYRLFGSRLLCRAFPRWIGRSAAIRGESANAEEWYGHIVHDILWKRLGLLLRDEQGRCQVSHQIISDYLLDLECGNRKRINLVKWLRKGLTSAAVCAAAMAVLMGYCLFIRPKPYDAESAERVFGDALRAYMTAGQECESMQDLVLCATQSPDAYGQEAAAVNWIEEGAAADPAAALRELEHMLETGSVMPWSRLPMDSRSCEMLLLLPTEIQSSYAAIVERMERLLKDDSITAELRELYIWAVSEMINRDTQIIANLYVLACEPHMTGIYSDPGLVSRLSPSGEGDDGTPRRIDDAALSVYIPLTYEQTNAAMDRSTEELEDSLATLSAERSALLDILMDGQ